MLEGKSMKSSERELWEQWYENRNRSAVPAHNVEPATRHESLAAQAVSRLGTPCCLHIISYRHRLCDSDGISAKAAIDGLVHGGILVDDSPEYVKEVTYSQVKVRTKDEERTEIIITQEES